MAVQDCKLVHGTQRGLDASINHVEDREARKTTENNTIAFMTLRQTEMGRQGSRQVQGAGWSRLQGEPATSRMSVARDDVLESKSQS